MRYNASRSEWIWGRWQWRGTPHSPKLPHYWNLTIRLFNVSFSRKDSDLCIYHLLAGKTSVSWSVPSGTPFLPSPVHSYISFLLFCHIHSLRDYLFYLNHHVADTCYYYFTSWELFFTSVLVDCFSLEFEWQQVTSSLQVSIIIMVGVIDGLNWELKDNMFPQDFYNPFSISVVFSDADVWMLTTMINLISFNLFFFLKTLWERSKSSNNKGHCYNFHIPRFWVFSRYFSCEIKMFCKYLSFFLSFSHIYFTLLFFFLTQTHLDIFFYNSLLMLSLNTISILYRYLFLFNGGLPILFTRIFNRLVISEA